MKTKQIVGIIVAAFAIIAVGVTGVLSNVIQNKFAAEETSAWTDLFSMDTTGELTIPEEDFVGVIDVVGEIGPSSSSVYGTGGSYDHSLYMDFIDEMMYADNNKGIMLYVDSPGGTVYESDELYVKLMEYKEETGRPIWAYFASEACSGGYYIAMAADEIYANRNCWTGSIGVIVSLMNLEGLYDKLGIEEINIASGANKAMGAAGSELTEEQRAILQSLVDEAYDQFVDIIAKGRNMSDADVRKLADGRIYSAQQALKVDLIDAIGSYEEAVDAFIAKEKFAENIYFYAPESGMDDLMSYLFYAAEQIKPKSDSELATEIIENNGNGVLKYYAE